MYALLIFKQLQKREREKSSRLLTGEAKNEMLSRSGPPAPYALKC